MSAFHGASLALALAVGMAACHHGPARSHIHVSAQEMACGDDTTQVVAQIVHWDDNPDPAMAQEAAKICYPHGYKITGKPWVLFRPDEKMWSIRCETPQTVASAATPCEGC